jgi:hypothetical protein
VSVLAVFKLVGNVRERQRLDGRHYGLIQFRNGYATKAPEMLVEFAVFASRAGGATPITPFSLAES